MKCKIGDWIRFYQDGVLVIGVVNYIGFDPVLQDEYYSTDVGRVVLSCVLEKRESL